MSVLIFVVWNRVEISQFVFRIFHPKTQNHNNACRTTPKRCKPIATNCSPFRATTNAPTASMATRNGRASTWASWFASSVVARIGVWVCIGRRCARCGWMRSSRNSGTFCYSWATKKSTRFIWHFCTRIQRWHKAQKSMRIRRGEVSLVCVVGCLIVCVAFAGMHAKFGSPWNMWIKSLRYRKHKKICWKVCLFFVVASLSLINQLKILLVPPQWTTWPATASRTTIVIFHRRLPPRRRPHRRRKIM